MHTVVCMTIILAPNSYVYKFRAALAHHQEALQVVKSACLAYCCLVFIHSFISIQP